MKSFQCAVVVDVADVGLAVVAVAAGLSAFLVVAFKEDLPAVIPAVIFS